MVSVEGRNYEVQEHFMDDESGDDSSYSKGATFEPPTTDHQAVVDILSFVHDNRQVCKLLHQTTGMTVVYAFRRAPSCVFFRAGRTSRKFENCSKNAMKAERTTQSTRAILGCL